MKARICLPVLIRFLCASVGPALLMMIAQTAVADSGIEVLENPGRIGRNDCGTLAVYAVLSAYGYHPDYEVICANMAPGIYGNTLAQLAEYLQSSTSDLRFSVARISTRRLRNALKGGSDRKAIIHMNDHWVVVNDLIDESFEVIDFPKKYYVPCTALDRLWDGYAIVASRKAVSIPRFLGVCMVVASVTGATILTCRRAKRCGRSHQVSGLGPDRRQSCSADCPR